MKISFKNILIIFLVALLGGACGTYGVIAINNSNNKTVESDTSSSNTVT